jgi:hypothetical protein
MKIPRRVYGQNCSHITWIVWPHRKKNNFFWFILKATTLQKIKIFEYTRQIMQI